MPAVEGLFVDIVDLDHTDVVELAVLDAANDAAPPGPADSERRAS